MRIMMKKMRMVRKRERREVINRNNRIIRIIIKREIIIRMKNRLKK
jgi:hypothetical protein